MYGLGYREFVVLALIICGIYAFMTRTKRVSKDSEGGPGPEGLGGWLTFVGLGVVTNPFLLFGELYAEIYPVLSQIDWHGLNRDSITFTFLLGCLIIAAWLALIAWSVYNVVLFFRKRRRFRKAYIILTVLLMVVAVAGAIFDPNVGKSLGPTLWGGAIWIAYMLKSQRVKNTFVR